jgi:hypothetical protein
MNMVTFPLQCLPSCMFSTKLCNHPLIKIPPSILSSYIDIKRITLPLNLTTLELLGWAIKLTYSYPSFYYFFYVNISYILTSYLIKCHVVSLDTLFYLWCILVEQVKVVECINAGLPYSIKTTRCIKLFVKIHTPSKRQKHSEMVTSHEKISSITIKLSLRAPNRWPWIFFTK